MSTLNIVRRRYGARLVLSDDREVVLSVDYPASGKILRRKKQLTLYLKVGEVSFERHHCGTLDWRRHSPFFPKGLFEFLKDNNISDAFGKDQLTDFLAVLRLMKVSDVFIYSIRKPG